MSLSRVRATLFPDRDNKNSIFLPDKGQTVFLEALSKRLGFLSLWFSGWDTNPLFAQPPLELTSSSPLRDSGMRT